MLHCTDGAALTRGQARETWSSPWSRREPPLGCLGRGFRGGFRFSGRFSGQFSVFWGGTNLYYYRALAVLSWRTRSVQTCVSAYFATLTMVRVIYSKRDTAVLPWRTRSVQAYVYVRVALSSPSLTETSRLGCKAHSRPSLTELAKAVERPCLCCNTQSRPSRLCSVSRTVRVCVAFLLEL